MKLIAGLGNPGPEYLNTRHNAGFLGVDCLLSRYGLEFRGRKYHSPFTIDTVRDIEVAFIKPNLYMNLSGKPVKAAMNDLGILPESLLVIHDDIDIPLGDVRYKTAGGHGGHNGVRSIIEELGSPDFHRIRIGVGRPPKGVSGADYVLDSFNADEDEAITGSLEKTIDLVENHFLINGILTG